MANPTPFEIKVPKIVVTKVLYKVEKVKKKKKNWVKKIQKKKK